jgi:hypothetical protein
MNNKFLNNKMDISKPTSWSIVSHEENHDIISIKYGRNQRIFNCEFNKMQIKKMKPSSDYFYIKSKSLDLKKWNIFIDFVKKYSDKTYNTPMVSITKFELFMLWNRFQDKT